MQSLTNVLGNGLEDATDDLISNFLFSQMKNFNDKTIIKGENLGYKEEFFNTLVTTTSMGLTLWSYNLISNNIQKLMVRSAIYWTYISTGKLKKKIADLKTKNIKGKKALNMLGAVIGTDKTGERIQVTKIINDNLISLDNQIHKNKMEKLSIENKFLELGKTSAQIKGVSSQENFNLYLHKLKSSTWKNTNQDKKLFERITGENISTGTGTSWADLVKELNNFSEYAKDIDGNIFNLTEAILKITNRANLAK